VKKLFVLIIAGLSISTPSAQSQDAARKALLERAKQLELNTPYVPPPGEAIEHYASGYAKIMCSSVFITGLTPEFARERRLLRRALCRT
jgi:curli biogenesis system outer membrane secretion channel CsgG